MVRFAKGSLLFFMIMVVVPGYAQFTSDNINVHGFISQGYLKTTGNNYLGSTKDGSFEFTDAAINFSIQLTDNLRGGFQLYSRDLGTEGDNQVVLDWGYLDYRKADYLGLRLGKVKVPMGLYNQGRDIDALRTSILLPQSVYTETWRDFILTTQGGSLYGTIPTSKAGYFDYEVFGGTVNIGGNSIFVQDKFNGVKLESQLMLAQQLTARGQMQPGMELTSAVNNPALRVKYMYGGGLKWNTPLPGLLLGTTFLTSIVEMSGQLDMRLKMGGMVASTFSTDYIADVDVKDFITYSAQYTFSNLNLTTEYLTRTYLVSANGMEREYIEEGYYGMATYRFASWLELSACYSEFYPDVNDKDGDRFLTQGLPRYIAWQKESAVSVRFDVSDSWIVKLEAHLIDGAGIPTMFENPTGLEKEWELFAVKTSFTF